MHCYRMVWEDEIKDREVELFADYRLESGLVTIDAIRATQVTLYHPETKQPSRTLPVHTATGCRLLAEAYLASRDGQPSLEDEILAAHELRDGLNAVTV